MNPDEIKAKFGADALRKLYEVILDRSVYAMADWILVYHDEVEIKLWLEQLAEDELE
jgi:hypothetical protein